MKNLLATIVAIGVLAVSAFSQTTTTTKTTSGDVVKASQSQGPVSAQSVAVTTTSTSVNLVYLRDGYTNYTAIAVPFYTLPGLNGKVKADVIGAYAPNGSPANKVYSGLGLDWNFLSYKQYSFDLYGGVKGLNLSNNLQVVTGKDWAVFGLGFTLTF